MLIYVEGLDRSGKSTFAKELSARLRLPIYRKMPPVGLELGEHHSYFKGIGFALTELHNLFRFNAIIDRSFVSDWVYTNRDKDTRPIVIWQEWERRHTDPKSVIIVYVEASRDILEARTIASPDPYMGKDNITRFQQLYESYLGQTQFRVIRINGTSSFADRAREIEMVELLLLSL